MAKEKIIIKVVKIRKVGEKNRFQIRLPKNTQRIVGIMVTTNAGKNS
jgi:hypothetical protein